jgi:alanine dehydrogenase
MAKIKIGILKEGKTPPDKRVPLTPIQCRDLITQYPNLSLVVQKSPIRCFDDEEYVNLGIPLVDDVSECDLLFGVKEVVKSELLERKTYFYFSHTIKEQSYNRALLQTMIAKGISMVDYETLIDSNGRRILGFGRYAGVVGCYNGFLAYGKRTKRYSLKAAHQCHNRMELEQELQKVDLPTVKIIVSGNGRVGQGALEIIKQLNIREVSIKEFVSQSFDEAVYVHLDFYDYNERIDGSAFSNKDFFSNPELFQSCFMNYASCADIFIAGHYYGKGSPYLFTREDAKSSGFKIRTIADISCDIDGPVASTIRPSTIAEPIYGYNPHSESEDVFDKDDVITVMAVDNLPCELPKDASEDFGNALIQHVFPCLFGEDSEQIIARATICENGDLTTNYEYLREYVNTND